MIRLIILQGKFDSLNKLIGAMNANRYAGNTIKQRNQKRMVGQLNEMEPFEVPESSDFIFKWHRCDKREDPDNITTGVKYFFDALQEVGWLERDSWKFVKSIRHEFYVDVPKGMEYVEVVVSNEDMAFVPEARLESVKLLEDKVEAMSEYIKCLERLRDND